MTVHISTRATAALVAAFLLAACGDATQPSGSQAPATTESEETSSESTGPMSEESAEEAEDPSEVVADTGDRVVYAFGSHQGEWGLYSSTDGVLWETVEPFPAELADGAELAPGSEESLAVYRGDHVFSAESGWKDGGLSEVRHPKGTTSEVTPRAYANGSWWVESLGIWSSTDGRTWTHVQKEWAHFEEILNGRAASDALPLGAIRGNGNLMLIPKTFERAVPTILQDVDDGKVLTAPVWTSRDGKQWERREVQVAGELPVDGAYDVMTDHYVWDGSRWLWQLNDVLYVAEDAGGPLVFERVSEIGADGETARATIAAAGDLLVAPATDAEPEYGDGFVVGGKVLISTDGGTTWTVRETDVYLSSVEAIATR